jgi:hypothetical protein
MQLQDFFPYYPPRDNRFLQQKLLNKQEFAELSLRQYEQTAPSGFMNSQKIIQRFTSEFTLYDELIVYHETGSGKSGVAFAITEQLRESGSFNRAFIVAKSHDLLNSLMKALVYQFSTRYTTPSKDVVNQLAYMRKQVSDFYTFKTTETFAKDFGGMSDQQLGDLFSNSIFIMDEAHDLSPSESSDMYTQFQRLFAHTRNRKVVLMSGTPMKDTVEDIAPLFNLILPLSEQFPEGKLFREQFVEDRRTVKTVNNAIDVSLRNVDVLKTKMMGRITFLLAPPFTSVSKKFMGGNLSADVNVEQFRLVYETMEGPQLEAYTRAMIQDRGGDTDGSSSTSFYTNAVQAALLVFPDGSWGDVGYKQNTNKGAWLPATRASFATLDRLRQYSTKYYNTIYEILDRPAELFYLYASKIRGSGIQSFVKILQLYGFEPLRSTRDRTKQKRYIVLTSETDNVNKYIDYFNHPRNRHGEYCQILIGSKKISQGFTFRNVLNVHILTLHWNYTETHQAIHRAYRFGSHKALLSEKNNRSNYVVRIYQHCAMDPTCNTPSIDKMMMVFSYTKDILCRKMDRVIKEISFDCPLTLARNVRTGEPYSRTCDYLDTCKYTCSQLGGSTEEDWSTYYLYNNVDVDIITAVSALFKKSTSLTFASIQDITKTSFFQLAKNLNSMVEYNIPIKTEIGLTCYLREHKNTYYLVNDIILENDHPELQLYIQHPLYTQQTLLVSALETAEQTKFVKVLKEIQHTPLEQVPELIALMTLDQRVFFFKRLCELKFIDGKNSLLIDFLINHFKNIVLPGTNQWVCAVSIQGKPMQCLSADRRWIDDCSVVNLQQLMYENPYGYYGIIDTLTGKFGIRDVRTLGVTGKKSREKRGSVCGESGWKKADLIRMYMELVPSPENALMQRINALQTFPPALLKIEQFRSLDAEPNPDFSKRYYAVLHSNTVTVLCGMLRQVFERLGLLVRDTIGTARRSVVV